MDFCHAEMRYMLSRSDGTSSIHGLERLIMFFLDRTIPFWLLLMCRQLDSPSLRQTFQRAITISRRIDRDSIYFRLGLGIHD